MASEQWVRAGQTVTVESDDYGIVIVSLDLFRDMIRQLGFVKVDA